MIQDIPGYNITEKLYESVKTVIYRAIRVTDGLPVAIKTLQKEFPTHEEMARFKKECNLQLKVTDIVGVADVFSIETVNNQQALVLEWIEAGDLNGLISDTGVDIELFFKLAIQLTQALGEIHQQYIIHKDINPRNILWDGPNQAVKIIDFGIASELSRQKPNLNIELLKGSLPYISPEQTGRMNRAIDYRSDFYSLGITFYQLLTGKLPYDVDNDDPMAWVHCHIAREAKPLQYYDPLISSALDAIIRKLMAKNAEARYQSAFGIKNDLEYCFTQWQQAGVISEFIPGQQDISEHFEIPQKLYGREKEIAALMDTFAGIVKGESKMFLVSGYSGIGKSALINEVHRPILTKQGYFIAGKFDQFQRNIPYSAITQAFRSLMSQLLTESSQQRLLVWRQELQLALGDNAQVLIEIIPELEQIIGVQPVVAHLGTEENQNRFNDLFLRFLGLFTEKDCPLVLFIDDLQWADSASINLLKQFMLNRQQCCFLLIGAYRDNEVDSSHPFIQTVEELKRAGLDISHLILKPLQIEHVNQLLAESVSADLQSTLPLAKLVVAKTAGNPFYVNQFLKNIYEIGLLFFDVSTHCWQWDLEKIKRENSSDNVVDLVVGKLQRLPNETRQLLRLASCIGNVFHLHTLSVISENNLLATARQLWPAVNAGLLLTDGERYDLLKNLDQSDDNVARNFHDVSARFLHDRVQQAAYSLIDDSHKQQVHLRIGRLLLHSSSEPELNSNPFSILEHFNKSLNLIEKNDERVRLAELNLQAGKKARGATAYEPALRYFTRAALCLQDNNDRQSHPLMFEIGKGQIECHFLLGEVEKGIEQSLHLLSQCKNTEEKIDVNNLLILYYGGAGEMDKSIDIALESLRYLDIDLPRNPNQVQLLMELAEAKLRLGRKSTAELMAMPEIEDKDILLAFSLLKELIAPTYLQGLTNLLPYIILRKFNLTLKHGNGPVSSFAYSGYALLWSKLDDFAEAYRFGVLAMAYNGKINNPPMEARCYFMTTSFALYWGQPLINSQGPRQTGLQKLIDTGEYFWGAYIYLFGFWQEVVLSKSLDELFDLTTREIKFADKTRQIEPYHVHTLHRNFFKNLAGETLQDFPLDEQQGDEAAALEYFERNITSTMGKFYHVVCRLLLHYYHGQYDQAISFATRADITEDVIRDGTYTRVMHTFFSCLSILAVSAVFKSGQHDKIYKQRKKKLKQWYRLFPENFAFMWYLLKAEEARIQHRDIDAIDEFEKAISAAQQNQSLFFESLARELFARFWLKRENHKIASVYMLEAGYLYYRWGATGKLKQLEDNYAELFKQSASLYNNFPVKLQTETTLIDDPSTSTTVLDKGSSLDINTLAKASQVLSGEMVMDRLLQQLMQFLIENAGAQKGILILKEDEQLVIEAQCSVENQRQVINQQSVVLDDADNLSIAIVRYAARRNEQVVLSNAGNDERFAADAYLHKIDIKSVLCLPLLKRGHLFGLLYLENNLAYGVFTSSRVEVLQVLAAEIVVSLDNARLYRNLEESNLTLEEKVKERTQVLQTMNKALLDKNSEIRESKKIIEEKSDNITRSIQYAQKIQAAMLPQHEKLAESLPNFFIIFKPKQIVSGDFYWFNRIDDVIFLVVADCTGHGVPGAFLSMIGHMLLNKIINEKKILSPARVLEHLHEEVRGALKQEGKTRQSNDGMDIGLCRIDLLKRKLTYAAAKRPLYLVKAQGEKNTLVKINGDRKSIGGRQKESRRKFNEQLVDFCNGDTVFLSSDGFVDQHDVHNKKFGSAKLEAILQSVVGKDAAKQQEIIIQALACHQGNELQRDDITLLGVSF